MVSAIVVTTSFTILECTPLANNCATIFGTFCHFSFKSLVFTAYFTDWMKTNGDSACSLKSLFLLKKPT
jgi:hypothetical protein